jgi:hypothetical protein
MILLLLMSMKRKVRLFFFSNESIRDLFHFIVSENRCDQCEQLCLPNAINQTEIKCACAQYYILADNGRSCQPNCAE